MAASQNQVPKLPDPPSGNGGFRFLFFSELLKRPVCAGKIKDRLGKLTDLVFAPGELYPEAVGIYLGHGWGKPSEFIPWDRVLRIEDDAIFVMPPDQGDHYPPFVDQPGWILLDKHLMGRTILDMDGRRIEVVNDVHLLESKGRQLLVHVDTSFNGFLRRWRLGSRRWIKDHFISWKYVQPLSVEDALTTDKVSLSLTRRQLRELPPEDLADALEQLSGKQQEALFMALDSETAAETLMEAEPRAQRQLVASLRKERVRQIFGEMTTTQIANLFSILPHDDKVELMQLLPEESVRRIQAILSERDAKARDLMDQDYLAFPKETRVGEVLQQIRSSGRARQAVSYAYVVGEDRQLLLGAVDLRELVLAGDQLTLGEIMASPVVAVEDDDTHEDVKQIFVKYHYRMVPVVDRQDRILGVIRYNDIMK
jgi:CBS domain-containing protein/sporulation protein YlmC with PRC-barrel domain